VAQASRSPITATCSGRWRNASTSRAAGREKPDWRAGRNAVYQVAALTIGARLAVADA
jgi:hypothetical protein